MLSLRECQEILGHQSNLCSESLEHLRSQLYGIAEDIVDVGIRSAGSNSSYISTPKSKSVKIDPEIVPNFELAIERLPDDQREEIIERSAIMEYNGGIPKDEAEKYALGRKQREPG